MKVWAIKTALLITLAFAASAAMERAGGSPAAQLLNQVTATIEGATR